MLRELGVDVEIREHPFGVPVTTPFAEDTEHAAWDADAITRFGRALDWTDSVFEEFSGWFNGKTSPVHLFWHSLDLAVTRFSGRSAGQANVDPVTQEAYSHEVISFGFWPGDDRIGDAAYYAYTAPEPDGLRDQSLPVGAWMEWGSGSLAILRYDAVRASDDPRRMLLAFCQAAYEAGARLAGWDTASFESRWCPTPAQLRQLQADAAGHSKMAWLSDAPGTIRTCGLCLRRAALYPLSYGRGTGSLPGLAGGAVGRLRAGCLGLIGAVRALALGALAGLCGVDVPARRGSPGLVSVARHGGAAPTPVDGAEVRVGCIDQVVCDTHASYGRTHGRRDATAATQPDPGRDHHRVVDDVRRRHGREHRAAHDRPRSAMPASRRSSG